MHFASWISAWLLCCHLAQGESTLATSGAAPESTQSKPAWNALHEDLLALESEMERWSASAEAQDPHAHQRAMEGFAQRRVDLLLQRALLLGDEASAARLQEERRGAPMVQPLSLDRQTRTGQQKGPEMQSPSPTSREEIQ